MRALVTGAGGFLGRAIVEHLLSRGDRVKAFARSDYPELRALGAQTVRGDIRDLPAMLQVCEDCDVVFHTAAIAGVWGKWDDYHSVNTVGTQNVIAGCRQHGVGKLVFTSSPSVTFDGGDQHGVNERAAVYARRWLCHYPHSKALAEQAVLAANGTPSGAGELHTCALRPHLIWGPRDPHLVPRLLERAEARQLRRVGDGSNLIDMVYVDNAALAHLQAADALGPGAAVCGSAYFISQGEPVNCWQWIDQILELAGLPPVDRAISFRTAWRLGAALERWHGWFRPSKEPRITRFVAAQLGRSHYFDISAARRDFGYEPMISTAEGMQRLANSWANR